MTGVTLRIVIGFSKVNTECCLLGNLFAFCADFDNVKIIDAN